MLNISGNFSRSMPRFQIDPVVFYVTCTLNILIAVLAVLGNGLVLISFTRTARLRKHQTNYFIASLAVADLVVGAVTVPLWTYQSLDNFSVYYGKGDKTLYYVYQSFDVFSVAASIFHLMFVSLERYFAIVWPVIHHVATPLTYTVVLAAVWLVSIVVSSFSVKASQISRKNYAIFNYVFLFGIPLIVIVFSYLSIVRVTRKRQKNSRKAVQKELKVSFTVFILVGLFVITWAPFFIAVIYVSHNPSKYSLDVAMFLKVLHFSNSFCNPIVYAARIPDFRKAFSNLLPKRLLQYLFCRPVTHSESPPTSRARTASSLSVQTAMIDATEDRSNGSRRRPTLRDDKAITRHLLPVRDSLESASAEASPNLVDSYLSSSPVPLTGCQITSV